MKWENACESIKNPRATGTLDPTPHTGPLCSGTIATHQWQFSLKIILAHPLPVLDPLLTPGHGITPVQGWVSIWLGIHMENLNRV